MAPLRGGRTREASAPRVNHDAESRAARRSFAPLGPAHPSLQDDSTVESCLRLVGDKNASCGAETFTRGTSSRDVAAPRLVFFRPVPNAERIGLRRWHRSAVDGRASRVLLARITTRSRGQRGDPSLPSDPGIHSGDPVFVGTRVPVRTLLDYIEGGDSLEVFLDNFPSVSREQAIAFLEEAGRAALAQIA